MKKNKTQLPFKEVHGILVYEEAGGLTKEDIDRLRERKYIGQHCKHIRTEKWGSGIKCTDCGKSF